MQGLMNWGLKPSGIFFFLLLIIFLLFDYDNDYQINSRWTMMGRDDPMSHAHGLWGIVFEGPVYATKKRPKTELD